MGCGVAGFGGGEGGGGRTITGLWGGVKKSAALLRGVRSIELLVRVPGGWWGGGE